MSIAERPFSSESRDFVVASHFLEHCRNPIGTLETFFRVLKLGGKLYLVVPDKRFTFDVNRPTTTLERILEDYGKGNAGSHREHYLEWARFVENEPDETIESHVDVLIISDYSIHFHVWTYFEIQEFVLAGNECIFILKKTDTREAGTTHAR